MEPSSQFPKISRTAWQSLSRRKPVAESKRSPIKENIEDVRPSRRVTEEKTLKMRWQGKTIVEPAREFLNSRRRAQTDKSDCGWCKTD